MRYYFILVAVRILALSLSLAALFLHLNFCLYLTELKSIVNQDARKNTTTMCHFDTYRRK